MRSRQLVIGLGLLFATALPARARAQAAAPASTYPAACPAVSISTAKSDEAHSFYNVGRALYDEGNYDGAITQFREAYRRDCSKHDLLVIISRSYELKGDKVEAVKALELFLDRVKDSPDAGTHRTKIDNLKKQIAAAPPPAVAPPIVAPPPVEVREHTVPPWIVVGVGGAGVIVGAVLLIVRPKFPKSCDEATGKCKPDPALDPNSQPAKDGVLKDQDAASTSVGLRTGGTVALIAGGAVLVGGLLWHFLEPTGPVTKASVKPSLTPAVAPGYAGLSLGGSF